MMNKRVIIISLLTISVIANIYQLLNHENIEKPIDKTTKNITQENKLYQYNLFRVFSGPINSKNISRNEKYQGYVMLSVGNTKLKNPEVIIADTLVNGKYDAGAYEGKKSWQISTHDYLVLRLMFLTQHKSKDYGH